MRRRDIVLKRLRLALRGNDFFNTLRNTFFIGFNALKCSADIGSFPRSKLTMSSHMHLAWLLSQDPNNAFLNMGVARVNKFRKSLLFFKFLDILTTQ